jgi:hypothetical protein
MGEVGYQPSPEAMAGTAKNTKKTGFRRLEKMVPRFGHEVF